MPFLQLPFPRAPFPFGCHGVPHLAALALQFALRCAKAPRKAAWPRAEEALAETSPRGPAATCESQARRGSPGWINSFFNQATVFALEISGKTDPLSPNKMELRKYIYFYRQGNVLLPSHRFQSTLASPENKQPLPCFFLGSQSTVYSMGCNLSMQTKATGLV